MAIGNIGRFDHFYMENNNNKEELDCKSLKKTVLQNSTMNKK